MNADERIGLIRVKLARAYHHIEELEARIKTFLDDEPYKVGIKPHPEFPDATHHYLASAKPVVRGIPIVAGEVLQQTRSALDHLAWHLVDIGCAKQGIVLSRTEQKQIGFPIIDTDAPAQYEASRKAKVKGMTQAAINVIDKIKPYKGGNDLLWKLNQLNNIDKHRLLIAVGSAVGSFSAPRFIMRGLGIPPELLNFNLIPDPEYRKCPLNEGDELAFGFGEILDKDEEMRFTFEIVFNEAGVVECEPILPLLVQMVDYVNNLVLGFKPLLV